MQMHFLSFGRSQLFNKSFWLNNILTLPSFIMGVNGYIFYKVTQSLMDLMNQKK